MRYHVYVSIDKLPRAYRVIREDNSSGVLKTVAGGGWRSSAITWQDIETHLEDCYRKLGTFNNVKLK